MFSSVSEGRKESWLEGREEDRGEEEEKERVNLRRIEMCGLYFPPVTAKLILFCCKQSSMSWRESERERYEAVESIVGVG